MNTLLMTLHLNHGHQQFHHFIIFLLGERLFQLSAAVRTGGFFFFCLHFRVAGWAIFQHDVHSFPLIDRFYAGRFRAAPGAAALIFLSIPEPEAQIL